MPEIVKQGKLFKAVSPLYKINNKEKEFILNKKEYIEVFEKSIRKNMRVANAKTKKIYSDIELQNLLMDTRDYLETLQRTSSHLAVNPVVLEYICIHKDDKDFKEEFHSEFPELYIDKDNVMSGIYDGEYQILIMDRIFDKSVKQLSELIYDCRNYLQLYVYEVFNGKLIEKGLMSLGQFLSLTQKFQPVIKTRFKGLGELGASDLRDTTLSPENRILIRLTVEDIERDLQRFEILHGNNAEERKRMMDSYKISREDLDN